MIIVSINKSSTSQYAQYVTCATYYWHLPGIILSSIMVFYYIIKKLTIQNKYMYIIIIHIILCIIGFIYVSNVKVYIPLWSYSVKQHYYYISERTEHAAYLCAIVFPAGFGQTLYFQMAYHLSLNITLLRRIKITNM